MDPWIKRMVRQVRALPPSCLAGFHVSPVHARAWDHWAAWALTCPCGGSKGRILGHPLRNLAPDYDGPPAFASPLSFACSSCGTTTPIIDTGLHGYNSEVSKDEGRSCDPNYRGSGRGEAIPCPHCGAAGFSVRVMCGHSHFDLIEDEPELEPRAQEFFDSFQCRGTCSACGKGSTLASFELA